MDEIAQPLVLNVKEFCDTRPASLQMRYYGGEWQAQIASTDGTFSATAHSMDIDDLFSQLDGKIEQVR